MSLSRRIRSALLVAPLAAAVAAVPLAASWWHAGPLAFEAVTYRGAVEGAVEGAPPALALAAASTSAADVWLELTPLENELPATLVVLPAEEEPDGRELSLPGLSGAVLACGGGAPWAVTCRELYLQPGDTPAPVFDLAEGIPAGGRYLLDDLPVPGVQVAVVPAGLETLRPFVMPLGLAEASASEPLSREVLSEEDGRFTLPPLAPGDYFLEALLPSGRVHHSAPFTLPAPAGARIELGIEDGPVVWPLGDLEVGDGLAVNFLVTDDVGRPLADAAVSGRQGTTPRGVVLFQGHTDEEGRARLSGFDVERPVTLGCRAEGFREVELDFELLPTDVECRLEPLARLAGTIYGFDGLPLLGAVLSLLPPADGPETATLYTGEPLAVAVPDDRGRFALVELEPGEYRLLAVAPGHEPEARTLVVAAGERQVLDPFYLRPGGTVEGVAIDAESGATLPGVQVVAVEPPGAAFAVTDDYGRFSLIASRETPLVLEAYYQDYLPARLELGPDDLDDGPAVLAFERGGYALALVWDGVSGAPCRGCPVVLHPGGEERLTDGEGEAFYGPLAPGRYRVSRPAITHRGSTVIEQPRAEVRYVRVRRDRVSLAWFGDRNRRLEVRFRPEPGDGWMLAARGRGRAQTVYPGADGAFVVEQEEGERLSLYLLRWMPESEALLEVLQGRVDPVGERLDDGRVVLDLARGEIRATVTSEGSPVAFTRVRLRDVHSAAVYARARTDGEGRLRLLHVPPGVYNLEVGERPLELVRVGAGELVELGTFDLVRGSF